MIRRIIIIIIIIINRLFVFNLYSNTHLLYTRMHGHLLYLVRTTIQFTQENIGLHLIVSE